VLICEICVKKIEAELRGIKSKEIKNFKQLRDLSKLSLNYTSPVNFRVEQAEQT
jgi:hypothetical protein